MTVAKPEGQREKRPLPKNDLAELVRQGTLNPDCYEEYLRSLPFPDQEPAGKASTGIFDDEELWHDELSRTYDAIMSREARKPEGGRGRPKGTDYRDVDAPLHDEMRRLRENAVAPSLTAAARMVADRAFGKATVQSRVTRLVRTYPFDR